MSSHELLSNPEIDQNGGVFAGRDRPGRGGTVRGQPPGSEEPRSMGHDRGRVPHQGTDGHHRSVHVPLQSKYFRCPNIFVNNLCNSNISIDIFYNLNMSF